MVRALEWNRDNIQYFGGNPNQVTILGDSTGAISVYLLTLSNLTKGLFHRYITESGLALSYIAHSRKEVHANRAMQLEEHFGGPTNTSKVLINCLKRVNQAELVHTDSMFEVWNGYPRVIWNPTIEPDIEGAFITDRPVNIIASGKNHDLPWLSSLNRDEGIVIAVLFYNRPDLFEDFLDNIDVVLPPMLSYDTLIDDVPVYTAALKSFYLNDLTANRTLLLNNVIQLIGDVLFFFPTYSASQKRLAHAKNPQYFCSFEYRGTFSYSYFFSGGSTEDHGVSHADELFYLFPQPYSHPGPPGTEMNEADWKMVDTMVQLWTSFAMNGKPTTEDSNTRTIWEPFSSPKNYLRIGNNSDISIGVEVNYLEDRMKFLEELSAAISWK